MRVAKHRPSAARSRRCRCWPTCLTVAAARFMRLSTGPLTHACEAFNAGDNAAVQSSSHARLRQASTLPATPSAAPPKATSSASTWPGREQLQHGQHDRPAAAAPDQPEAVGNDPFPGSLRRGGAGSSGSCLPSSGMGRPSPRVVPQGALSGELAGDVAELRLGVCSAGVEGSSRSAAYHCPTTPPHHHLRPFHTNKRRCALRQWQATVCLRQHA